MDTKWQALMGFATLSSRGAITIKGKDAFPFLQGQLTVNLSSVTPNQSQLAAHCNLKGRMQALFRIIQIDTDEPSYLLLAPKELIPIAIKNLKKYALFSKVTIEESNAAFFGIIGENAVNALAEYQSDDRVKSLANGGCLTQLHPAGTLTLCKVPGTNSRFELIVARSDGNDIKQQFLSNATLLHETDWERYDIEAGIPAIYPATIDTLLPHHVNLTELGGISFDKGCYLGQEIVARMHYRGKIKRHMYLAELENNTESPCPGDQIVILNAPNEAPGVVVRASPKDQGFVLLVVLDEQYADFNNIRFKKADGPKLHRPPL